MRARGPYVVAVDAALEVADVFRLEDGRYVGECRFLQGVSPYRRVNVTLFGDVSRGRRPSFESAERPELAERLYEDALARFRVAIPVVRSGRFRADMQVFSQVDGPVTLILDSRRRG